MTAATSSMSSGGVALRQMKISPPMTRRFTGRSEKQVRSKSGAWTPAEMSSPDGVYVHWW